MKEIGIIFKNRGDDALVTIQRHAACGDCGACHIGREKATMETLAKNPIEAQVGQTVEVEMEFVSVFGYLMVDLFQLNFDQVLTSFFTGIILMILSYFVIQQLDKKGIFHGKYMPTITSVITPIDCEKSAEEKILGF